MNVPFCNGLGLSQTAHIVVCLKLLPRKLYLTGFGSILLQFRHFLPSLAPLPASSYMQRLQCRALRALVMRITD